MKNALYLLIVAGTLATNAVHAQWRAATPYNGTFNDVVFTDRLTGFACGSSVGTGSCSGTGSIHRTIDGGKNWVRMNTGSTYAMNTLFFLNSFTGWALGASSTVIKTTDGGQSWTTQTTGVGSGLNDIHFPDANTGYVVGASGNIRKTTSGGSSWTTITSGTTNALYGVWFVNANTGYAVGNGGTIRKTTNGGGTWTSVYSGTTEAFRDVWFADANNGYVMAYNKILRTSDGGSTWSTFDATVGWTMRKFHFLSVNKGYVVGDPNLVARTEDGGQTWNALLPTNTLDTWYDVDFIDDMHGYAARDLGRIEETFDGGLTWTNNCAGLSKEMYDIAFTTPREGILTGSSGTIYKTLNGGLTFRDIPSGTTQFLGSVQYMTPNRVIAAGASGTMLKSEDAGEHWDSIPVATTANFTDLHAVDSLYAYATSDDGKLWRTINGGQNWFAFQPGSATTLSAVYFHSRNVGMVTGNGVVYKTTNAGVFWQMLTNGIELNSNFSDIWMTSASTAYVTGTFGRLHKTIDGGNQWEPIYPVSPSNADIDEMFWVTDSIGYYASFNSQYFTLNGGYTAGSQSTACLANNGGINSIFMVDGQNYGYSTGGLSRVFHTRKPNEITRTYLQDSVFCSGQRIFVGYDAGGLLISTHVVTAQLSDANGSFDSPTNIGSYTLGLPAINPSGIITCTLPTGLNGTGYRIRVVMDNPAITGPDNGINLRISSTVAPQLALTATPQSVCPNTPMLFEVQSAAAGSNALYVWTLNGNALDYAAPTLTLDTLSAAGTVSVQLSSSLSCAFPATVSQSVDFGIGEAPVFDLGPDLVLCAGDTASLGVQGNFTAVWSPALQLSEPDSAFTAVFPDQTRTYTLTLVNDAGCAALDSVTIEVNPSTAFTISTLNEACEGDTVFVQVNGLDVGTLEWSAQLSESSPGIWAYLGEATPLQATFTNALGCESTQSTSVVINPTPAAPTLVLNGTELHLEPAWNGPVIWALDGNPIPDESNDTLTIQGLGTYTAQVQSEALCISALSNAIDVSSVGLQAGISQQVHFWKSGDFIRFAASSQAIVGEAYSIYSMQGALMQYGRITHGEISLSDLSQGLYILKLESGIHYRFTHLTTTSH